MRLVCHCQTTSASTSHAQRVVILTVITVHHEPGISTSDLLIARSRRVRGLQARLAMFQSIWSHQFDSVRLGSSPPQKLTDFIRTTIHDQYSHSMKITTRLDQISDCKTASGTNWSNRWTYRVFFIDTRRDQISTVHLACRSENNLKVTPSTQFKNDTCRNVNRFKGGSYLRLIDLCITQL